MDGRPVVFDRILGVQARPSRHGAPFGTGPVEVRARLRCIGWVAPSQVPNTPCGVIQDGWLVASQSCETYYSTKMMVPRISHISQKVPLGRGRAHREGNDGSSKRHSSPANLFFCCLVSMDMVTQATSKSSGPCVVALILEANSLKSPLSHTERLKAAKAALVAAISCTSASPSGTGTPRPPHVTTEPSPWPRQLTWKSRSDARRRERERERQRETERTP